MTALLPKKIKYEIFSPRIINSDRKLRLNASMVALKKIKEDDRRWRNFKNNKCLESDKIAHFLNRNIKL